MTAVRFSKVSKAFGRRPPVLRDIDLDIEDGTFVTLVGPSGCGKSTLLNVIAGFERPTRGEILFDGEVYNDKSPRERGAAMVFQSYALYPHLDVRHNLAFPLDVAGVHPVEIDERVLEIAVRLKIDGLLDRLPKNLSGGQRQRVALGRALVRRTRLCLFDEPLSNLDPALREQMRGEIKKLHEEFGATFVYVTHDQIEAMTMSDRIVVLNGGVIQQAAPPQEIFRRPSNTFVAGFFGSPGMNLVRPTTLSAPERRSQGRDLLLGVRPDDLQVGAGEPPEDAVAGKVYLVEPTGTETWVTLEIAGERVVGRADAEFALRSGAPAWVRHNMDHVLLFDAQTGQRVER